MSSYYAQDPTDVQKTIDAFTPHIVANPSLRWAVMFDSAFDYGGEALKLDTQIINCYSGVADLDDLASVAPCLVPLPSTEQGKERLRHLLRHASGRPMLSIVGSRIPLSQLCEGWQDLHWVYTDDRQRFLLRMADTRIVPELAKALSPEQWAAITWGLQHFFIIDRTGQLAELPAANPQAKPVARIELTARQLGALTDAAEADAMIDYLAQHMPDLAPAPGALMPSLWHAHVAASLELAQKYKVDNHDDKLALIVALPMTEGRVNDSERLKTLLQMREWTPGNLQAAMLHAGVV